MRDLYQERISLFESMHENYQMLMVNSLLEAYADRNENANLTYRFPEVSINSSLERERGYIEALEETITRKNNEILSVCSETALSKNPIGLSLGQITESDIHHKYESDSKLLMDSLRKVLESGDTDKICSYVNCLDGKNADVTSAIKQAACCGKNIGKSMDRIFNTECDKTVTKECIKEAVEFLESGCSKKIKEIKDKVDEKCKSYKEKACNMKNDMDKATKIVHGQCKKNESCDDSKKEGCSPKSCKNEAVASCFAVNTYLMEQDFIDLAYIVSLENQLLESVNNARKIVMCAYSYDPRNYAESLPFVQEMAEKIEEQSNESYDKCMDFDIDAYLTEAGLMDKFKDLKDKFIKSNKKFLDKYEDKALSSSCSGIVIDKWYTFVDLDSKYNDALKKLQSVFKRIDINNASEKDLKDFYKEIKDGMFKTGSARSAVSDFVKNDKGEVNYLYKNAAVKMERDHNVTKQDVKDAVDTLKSITTEIDSAYKLLNERIAALNTFAKRSTNIGLDKSEKYQRKIVGIKDDMKKALDKDYAGAVYWQLLAKQRQARKVISLAARDSSNEWASVFDDELDSINESIISYIE